MHEVTVIGGGFSGLAACMELERLGVPYLLVEVKRSVGGSLRTHYKDGYYFDLGETAFLDTLPDEFLDELTLSDARLTIREGVVTLPRGMAQLIDAMAQRVRGPRMMRTAVSSLGMVENQWGVCMENGVMLLSPRVIVAAPSRYAARMLMNPAPDAAAMLHEFVYGDMTHVSMAFRTQEVSDRVPFYRDPAYVYHLRMDHPVRVPEGTVQFQVGLRLNPGNTRPDEIVSYLCAEVELPQPIAWEVGTWPENHALSVYHEDHAAKMLAVHALLPPRMAIANSDYTFEHSTRGGVVRLDERLTAAYAAVAKVLNA